MSQDNVFPVFGQPNLALKSSTDHDIATRSIKSGTTVQDGLDYLPLHYQSVSLALEI